jgi:hypothetical protein
MRTVSENNLFSFFFNGIFITGLIPYLYYIIPSLPITILGVNYSGIAWILMLSITFITFLFNLRNKFSLSYWIPWVLYLGIYIIIKFSLVGLQLTIQYILPIFICIVASGFTYNSNTIKKVFIKFILLCSIIYTLFIVSKLVNSEIMPNIAVVPMTLSICASLFLGIFYLQKNILYLVGFFLLFLIPIIEITRMGILVFLLIFIAHFGERRLRVKILYLLLSIPIALMIFFSQGFQSKTFYSGSGGLTDLRLNYYESDALNSNGRKSWKNALSEGLSKNPFFGNGPRSDWEAFKYNNYTIKEAHNDYMAVRYNYGIFGLILLIIGLASIFIALFRKRHIYYKSKILTILYTSTMTLIFVLLMYMYSDNILKYTIFFPNILFAMIGILYAKYTNAPENTPKPTQIISPFPNRIFYSK